MHSKFVLARRLSSVILISLLWLSVLSFSVYAEEGGFLESIEFSADIAGVNPGDWYYFLDIAGTPGERVHEAGLMARQGDYDGARRAMDNFVKAVESDYREREYNFEGISLETLNTNEDATELYRVQSELLNYDIYINKIENIIEESINNGEVEENAVEGIVESAEKAVANAGAMIEEDRLEIVDAVSENSGLSRIEAEFEFEDRSREDFSNRFGDSRFEEISRINDVQEIKDKIGELKEEIAALEESGSDDAERLNVARQLLEMAESHGVECIGANPLELGIESFNHENMARDLVSDVERLLQEGIDSGSVFINTMPVPPTEEDFRRQISEEKEVADKFLERYETLKEKYYDSPEKLAVIEGEKTRVEKAQLLAEQLDDNGKLDLWIEELRAEGKREAEVQAEIHERVSEEWNYVYGEKYEPAGLYQNPREISIVGEGEQNVEVIGIGRIEVVKEINPETGLYEDKVIGWYNGKIVEDVHEGGGFALGVPYTDPTTGVSYSFGANGYSYVSEAGITHTVDYPEGYTPENTYNYGDEVYTYETGNGEEVVYSATGYEVIDETETALVGEPYTGELTNFVDGGFTDLEATGYIYNNNEGDARVYAYIPEFGTYQDIASGKISVPRSAPHIQGTTYDSATGTYKFSYAGQPWSYNGQGAWINPSGQAVNFAVAPAPVGWETRGEYVTRSGQTWSYDPATNAWKESTTGASYAVAPNNQYRYNEYRGYMTDTSGRALATVGTSVTGDDGRVYTVTGDRGWTDPEGRAVAPPQVGGVQQPSSVSGYYGGYGSGVSGSGQGGGGYYGGSGSGYAGKIWNYNTASKQWVSGETGDKYDAATGIITRADGSVSSPENRPAGQGSEGVCYGCYYSGGQTGGQGQAQVYSYAGGNYQMAPDGTYGYVSSSGEFQGSSRVTDSSGIVWSRDASGQYNGVKPDGSTITGSEYASQYSTYGGAGGYGYASGGYGYSGPGYSPGYGYGYAGGGNYYTADGTYVGPGAVDGYSPEANAAAQAAGYSSAAAAEAAGGSYYGSYSSTGGYYGGTGDYSSGGSYYGGTSGTSSGSWSTSGTTSGGYSSSGYTSGGDSGSTTTSGSTSGGSTSGSTTTSGGDSGGSSGGDSGGSSGGDSGGSVGGGVVAEEEGALSNNPIARFICRIMPGFRLCR